MAFHLEGPWLTTTGKKKGPRRWASAEAKRKAELLQQEWEQRLGNFKQMAPKFSKSAPEPKSPRGTLTVNLAPPLGRETPRIESRDTGWIPCVKKHDQTYTGDAVVGIAQMAKSNAVPVFDSDHIVEIARMRR